MKLQSNHALLDVERGRKKLLVATTKGKEFPVTIEGVIKYAFGNDDGVSQEFVVQVTNVTVGEGRS